MAGARHDVFIGNGTFIDHVPTAVTFSVRVPEQAVPGPAVEYTVGAAQWYRRAALQLLGAQLRVEELWMRVPPLPQPTLPSPVAQAPARLPLSHPVACRQ